MIGFMKRLATLGAMTIVVIPFAVAIGVLYVFGLHDKTERKLGKFLRDL